MRRDRSDEGEKSGGREVMLERSEEGVGSVRNRRNSRGVE